jgi:hypothetical protein
MEFISYSLDGDRALWMYEQAVSVKNDTFIDNFKGKIDLCSHTVHLISRDEIIAERLCQDDFYIDQIIHLFDTWKEMGKSVADLPTQKKYWEQIDRIGCMEPIEDNKRSSPVLGRFSGVGCKDHFFILLSGRETSGLPFYEIYYLANLWQLEQGAFPLHAAGVVHKNGLYLFGGPSGAGKSTVSYQSKARGDSFLDEDQVLIYQRKDQLFGARAWGYSLQTCNFPLRAYFQLIQDQENRLVPVTRATTTKLLIEGSSQILGGLLSGKRFEGVFEKSAQIARTISGYELHFRKSPDFWKLIDAEFGLA